MGVHADGGLKITIFPILGFGPKSPPPKAPLGVKIGGTDTEFCEESEKTVRNPKKTQKKYKNSQKKIQKFPKKKPPFCI